MNTTLVSTVDTPDGVFTVLMQGDAVVASGWTGDVSTLLGLIHPSLRPGLADLVTPGSEDAAARAVRTAVLAHYDGDLDAPAAIPVRQHSGEFRMRAWDVLRDVTATNPISYTEFASRAGSPSAVRAAAAACARNAAALFVPCHRVLRSDGTLGGFRYGLELKQRLLDREAG